jgi:hypothetical protein
VWPDEKLDRAERYRVNMMVASPLAGRLKVLLSTARNAGETTNRRELIGAIVLAAPADGPALARMLERYWHGTASDAVIGGNERETLAFSAKQVRLAGRQAAASSVTPAQIPASVMAALGIKRSVSTRVDPPDSPDPAHGRRKTRRSR